MLQIKARCIYCGGEMRFGMKTHYECGSECPFAGWRIDENE